MVVEMPLSRGVASDSGDAPEILLKTLACEWFYRLEIIAIPVGIQSCSVNSQAYSMSQHAPNCALIRVCVCVCVCVCVRTCVSMYT